jgi:hypothetical protein
VTAFKGNIYGFVVILRTHFMLCNKPFQQLQWAYIVQKDSVHTPPHHSLQLNVLLRLVQWYSCHFLMLF